jgi:transcription initiation factor IIF auxiliary subunit
MAFSVERQLIKSAAGRIKFWTPSENGREHYNVAIWIEGSPSELDSVNHVEYTLHPSFKQPARTSSDRESKFLITIWTWGTFKIDVAIHLRNGAVRHVQYYLSYELPPDDGTNYTAVNA